MKLYQITDAYRQIDAMLDDDTIPEDQLLQAIEDVNSELQTKVQTVAMFIQNLEATADAIKAAEKRMADRRKAIENRALTIRAYVLRCMQGAAITKVECPEFKLAVQKNPPRVVIDDEALIPIAYLRQPEPPPPKPDKKAILADMNEGVIIAGAHKEQDERLVIK